jgi:WXG100 family type VII secretion target
MSVSRFRADYAALKEIAQTFNRESDSVKQTLNTLKQNTETLRGGDWKGDAANNFYREMDGAVLPTLQRLTNALAEAARVTQKISQLAAQTDQAASQVFKLDADGDRHKTGEAEGISTGAVIGGVIGGVLGAVGGPLGAAAGAAAGAALGKAIENATADDPRVAPVQQKINSGNKQAAIDEAIKQYNIDTSAAKSIRYDPTVNGEGETDKDGNVRIGDAAFKSPAWLASTLGHESVHAQQTKNGHWNDTGQGQNMNEVEAYDYEVKHAQDNGLSHGEQVTVERRRAQHYNRLTPENKARADAGNFTVA